MKTDKQLLYEISRRVNAHKRNIKKKTFLIFIKFMLYGLMIILAYIFIMTFIKIFIMSGGN